MARPRKILALLTAARRDRRRIADWMRAHRADIAAELALGRGRWPAIMAVVAQLDLRDERGGPVTQDTASRTWSRIQCEAAAAQAERPRSALPTPPRLRPGEIAAGVRIPPSPSGYDHLLTEHRPARAAAATAPAASPSPAPAAALGAPPSQPADGATELIQDALRLLGTEKSSTSWAP